MAEFKEGDVVMLKSGGPSMTINKYLEDDDLYECVWFVDNKATYRTFKATTIEKLESSSF